MSTLTTDLKTEIRSILAEVINDDVPNNETDLVETGSLDSLALVSLIMELESQFAIAIDFDTLELESFRSVNSISRYVQNLQS